MPEINDWQEVPIDDWVEVKANPQPQPESGLGSRILADLGKRVSGIGEAFTAPDANPAYPSRFAERLLRAGGQVAGAAIDIPTEIVKSAYQTIVPEGVRESIAGAVTPVVQDIMQSPSAKYIAQKVKDNPNLSKDAEALMNIAGAVPMVKGASSLVKGATPYVKDIAAIGKEAIVGSNDPIALTKKVVDIGVRKGIKPTNLGRNPKTTKAFYGDVETASKDIVSNKGLIQLNGETGKVPVNLAETVDAIEQSKKINLDKFLGMQEAAGGAGAEIRPQGLVDELVKMAEATKGEAAHVAKFAERELPAYATQNEYGNWIAKVFTPQEAQANTAQLNKLLSSYFKNPTFEELSNTGVKLTIRDQMASALNDAVESLVGPGHQEFKNTWGSLKNMEGQVVHRFNVDARQATKGFFDLTTPFTAAKVIAGVAGKDPISLASAAAMWGAKKYLKAMNQPNRYIKGMFEGLDNINKVGLRNTPFFADRSLWSSPELKGTIEMPRSPLSMEIPFQMRVPPPELQGIPMPQKPSGLTMENHWIKSFNPIIEQSPMMPTVGPGPSPGIVGQGALSRILSQVPNRSNSFDKKIDWIGEK